MKTGVIASILVTIWWLLGGCSPRQIGLYDRAPEPDTLPHIGALYSIQIWENHINNEVWTSPVDEKCLSLKGETEPGNDNNGILRLTWNKQAENCGWLGIGFGWDNWASKNLAPVYRRAAVQFKVKSTKGTLQGLPWAMALEDYQGAQAWAGVFSTYIEGGQITENWTTVTVPLEAFNTRQFQADLSMVKQLIIQLEADGDVWIDDLKLVETQSQNNNQLVLTCNQEVNQAVKVQGTMWSFDHADAQLACTDEAITLIVAVRDGDAATDRFMLAFSTNPHADNSRKKTLLSDQVLFIQAQSQKVWSETNKADLAADVQIIPDSQGYTLKATIPYNSLSAQPWLPGFDYLFELGIEQAGDGEKKSYSHWNAAREDSFETSPAAWGRIKIQH